MSTNKRRINGGYGAWALLLAGGAATGVAGCSSDDDCRETRTCAVQPEAGAAGASEVAPEEPEAGGAGGRAGSGYEEPAASGQAGQAGAGATSDSGGAAGEGGAANLGGSASLPAEGGAGGAGEAPVVVVPPECLADADCSDGVACNGVERCAAEKCVKGKPPVCANTDAAHCAVACVESGNTYQCVSSALDTDGDGHGAKACLAKPGDDCDDAKKTVYAGAKELCDRVDNDCDGKVDLNDGLSFSGKAVSLDRGLGEAPSSRSRIARSEEAKLFGVIWVVSSAGEIVFEAYDDQGVRKVGPITAARDANLLGRPVIAAGGGGFAIAWQSGASSAKVRTIGATGQLGQQVLLEGLEGSGGLALAWSPSAKVWGVVGDHGVARIDASGAAHDFTHVFNKSLAIYDTQIVPRAGGFLVALSAALGGEADPRVYQFNAEMASPAPVSFENPAGNAFVQVAVRKDGAFAVVADGTASANALLSSYDKNSKLLCATKLLKGATSYVAGAAPSASGYTALFEGGGIKPISLVEVGAKCELSQVVSTPFTQAAEAQLAASASGYGITWENAVGSQVSIFGSNFCN